MNLNEAVEVWKANKPAVKEASKKVADAEKVLKEYFRRTGKPSYRGVGYTATEYQALDSDLARRLLGPRAVEAEVSRTREALTALG